MIYRMKSSSGDSRFENPYVTEAKKRQFLEGDKTPWTTSQIIRESKDQTSKIVEIKIITK